MKIPRGVLVHDEKISGTGRTGPNGSGGPSGDASRGNFTEIIVRCAELAVASFGAQ